MWSIYNERESGWVKFKTIRAIRSLKFNENVYRWWSRWIIQLILRGNEFNFIIESDRDSIAQIIASIIKKARLINWIVKLKNLILYIFI
jgi:hypothetical protein